MTTDIGRLTGSRASMEPASGLHPSGFDPERMKRSNVAVFTQPGQVIKMTLPDGFRFVGLVHGASPQTFPLHEQGVWEIDIPAMLAKGRYPVAVAVVDAAHVRAWEALSTDKVDALLDGIASAIEARSDETRSGSAEGESAASEAGDAR